MLELIRGDSKVIKVEVISRQNASAQGELFDLSGYTARLTIKRNENDTDHIIQEVVENIDAPELGVIVFELKPADTAQLGGGTLVYDVEIRSDADAEHLKVHTVSKGAVKVVKDVTTN